MILKFTLILLFLISGSITLNAQNEHIHRAEIFENDTLAVYILPTAYIVSYKVFTSLKERRDYERLVRYVKKVYPYAKLAGNKLNKYDAILKAAKNDAERKKLMKKAEKELRDEYEGTLRNFTFSQGKILIKLIDRESAHTSYDLLQQLRSGFYASIWQGVGYIFGYNLKVHYDPKGEDQQIEQIVELIEAGVI